MNCGPPTSNSWWRLNSSADSDNKSCSHQSLQFSWVPSLNPASIYHRLEEHYLIAHYCTHIKIAINPLPAVITTTCCSEGALLWNEDRQNQQANQYQQKVTKTIWCFLPILLMVRLVRAVMWQRKKERRPNLRNWAEVKQKRCKLDPTWPTIFVTQKKCICLTTSWYRISLR